MALHFKPEDLVRIPQKGWRAAVRCRLDGMSLAETAEELDCSVRAVKQRLRHARIAAGLPDGRARKDDPTIADRKEFSDEEIARLSPKEARVVRLRQDEGLNDRAIAERLGVAMKGIGPVLTKARKRVGKKLHMRWRWPAPQRLPAYVEPLPPLLLEDFMVSGRGNLASAMAREGGLPTHQGRRPQARRSA
jgi:predicted DNA-binding protein (UPF0251 family)